MADDLLVLSCLVLNVCFMVLLFPQVKLKVKQHPVFPSVSALVDITCTLLLLNPDFTTAWNVRYRNATTKQRYVLINVVIVRAMLSFHGFQRVFSLTVTQEGFLDVR